MVKAASSIGLRLAPLADLIWIFFLIFTGVGFVVMPLGIGPVEVQRWVGVSGLREALLLLLGQADAIWMVLAAVNIYFYTVQREGLSTARRWAAIVLVGSAVLEWIGVRTGFPFGPYVYTDNFGARLLGVLPFTIPLAWLVVVLCSRYLVLALLPRLNPWLLSLAVGGLALLTDLNMEPVAWKVRAYWVWYPADPAPPLFPPWQNYLSWFLAASVFAALLRGGRLTGRISARRPILVLLLINSLFLLVHLVRFWRS